MSSISIDAARRTYGGDALEDTVRRMVAQIGCTRVYAYANDYGDKRTPTDFYRIERADDEARLAASASAHNVQLVFDRGEFLGIVQPARGIALNRSALLSVWDRWVVGWQMRWEDDRPILLSVPILVVAWAGIALGLVREEFRVRLGGQIDWSDTSLLAERGGLALLILLSCSLLTGPIAWGIWSNLLDERHGYGWLIYAALSFALSLVFLWGS